MGGRAADIPKAADMTPPPHEMAETDDLVTGTFRVMLVTAPLRSLGAARESLAHQNSKRKPYDTEMASRSEFR